MAERSFAREVESLRLGEGEDFRGKGILALTKALLQCGVGYVAGYRGPLSRTCPISHLMDVLADAQPLLDKLGVHFESSASEAAAATLAAPVMHPIRGAVTWHCRHQRRLRRAGQLGVGRRHRRRAGRHRGGLRRRLLHQNPTAWDQLRARMRRAVIGALQRRQDARRVAFPA